MAWKRLFAREVPQSTGRMAEANLSEHVLIEPRKLLNTHRARLSALRLECGYDCDQFERLMGAVLLHAAEWVHFLPATRAENHRDSGGLLRFAVEAACLAYRRADGKFLSGSTATDVHSRERDRVWRYVAFLGALFRPLGRCVTHLQVSSSETGAIWNPLQEGLWHWRRRVETSHIEIHWRAGVDGRPTVTAAAWIAAQVIPASALAYLHSADDSLSEILLKLFNGERTGRLCEIVDEAYQAAIDLDIGRLGKAEETEHTGVQIEHRLLEALRALCREKWTLNAPGSRLWCTDVGVYLVWKPAVSDLLVRMRAEGITGVPRDPETLAELLVAHGVLSRNPNAAAGLKHYYRLLPQMRGIPKQALEVVKVADAELVGLQLHGVDRVPAQFVDSVPPAGASPKHTGSVPTTLELPLEENPTASTSLVAPCDVEPSSALPSQTVLPLPTAPRAAASLERLRRFGAPGLTLQKLALRMADGCGELQVVRIAEGIAIGFPEAIAAIGEQPQAFLAACELQGLLVAERAGGRQFVRTRSADQLYLPAQYIVLAPRIGKHLPLEDGDSV